MRKVYRKIIGILSLSLILTISFTKNGIADVVSGYSKSDLYMDVIEVDPNTQISVTVPVLFGFVVNGSSTTTDTELVNSNDAYVYLPNYIVNDEKLAVTSYTSQIKNYSTTMADGQKDPTERQGVAVYLNASLENKDDNSTSDKKWEAVIEDEINKGGTPTPYRYSLDFLVDSKLHSMTSIAGNLSLVDDSKIINKTVTDDEKGNLISIAEPPSDAGYNTDGTSVNFSSVNLQYVLNVGGTRGEYSSVENARQVGQIVWHIYTDDDLKTE